VVGAGISGLAAARVLAGGAPASSESLEDPVAEGDVEVLVLDAADRAGGKVHSGTFQGCAIDFGPDNFLTRDQSAAQLCRLLGLGDDLVPPATSSASVLARGRLRPLPRGLVLGIPTDLKALARSGIVSAPGLARAALDLVAPGPTFRASSLGLRPGEGPEWDAASIIGRRLGREVVQRLVDPLLGGINAGSTGQLSLAVVAPQVARQLDGRRSVIEALRPLVAPVSGADAGKPTRAGGDAKPLFLGLMGGLGRMVEALVADLQARSVTLRTGAEVTAVRRNGKLVELETSTGTEVVDAVVLATPGYSSARLLVDSIPPAAAELASVPYAAVVLVTLAWRSGSIPSLPNGSGFLVPRREGRLLTGCTFISSKWPHMALPAEIVIRASTGRYGDERSSAMSDEEVVQKVLGELEEMIGVSVPPRASFVQRWPKAFPQYLPGHLHRIERARAALSGPPPIELAGAVLGGIGIPACVTSGERAAVAVLGRLRG
jgi:oxygen-dependent protoporphyrinogen oxidase